MPVTEVSSTSPVAMSRTVRSKRSSPAVSTANATSRWSALTVSAPSEKNSLSPASTLPSTTTCSPGTALGLRVGSHRRVGERRAHLGGVLPALDGAGVVPPRPARDRHRQVGLLHPRADLLDDRLAQRRRGARCGPRRRRSRPRGGPAGRGPRGRASRRRGPRRGRRGARGRGLGVGGRWGGARHGVTVCRVGRSARRRGPHPWRVGVRPSPGPASRRGRRVRDRPIRLGRRGQARVGLEVRHQVLEVLAAAEQVGPGGERGEQSHHRRRGSSACRPVRWRSGRSGCRSASSSPGRPASPAGCVASQV